MYVFLGGSISSRSAQEAQGIAERVKVLCSVLDRLGHTYDVELLTDTKVSRESEKVEFEIPQKYLDRVSVQRVESVQNLRVENKPYSMRDEIACYIWSLDLLEKAGACIWDLTKSSSGSGFELALALQMKKPCLALFNRPTISTMLNGCTNRLLVVKRWDDNLEQTVEEFIRKAEQSLDFPFKFNVNQDMSYFIRERVKEGGFASTAEYLRHLVEKDKGEHNT